MAGETAMAVLRVDLNHSSGGRTVSSVTAAGGDGSAAAAAVDSSLGTGLGDSPADVRTPENLGRAAAADRGHAEDRIPGGRAADEDGLDCLRQVA